MKLRDLERLFQDPWHSRVKHWIADHWRCHIRRRHHEKLDSRGRCYRCGKHL